MNYNKIIKDLKKENDSLKNQYQLMQIRAVSGEFKQQRIDKAIQFINKYKFKGTETLEDRYLDDVLSCELIEILGGESTQPQPYFPPFNMNKTQSEEKSKIEKYIDSMCEKYGDNVEFDLKYDKDYQQYVLYTKIKENENDQI